MKQAIISGVAALGLVVLPALAQAKTQADVAIVKQPMDAFATVTQQHGWLNTSRPLLPEDLHGRLVLLDFWTYCCINCMQILPELGQLETKFSHDLTVIGVHSAKFKNEGETENIRQAILRYGIHHPVVNDFNFATWNAFKVEAWPTFVLIDPNGKVVAQYSGERHFAEMEKDIERVSKDFKGKIRADSLPLKLEKEKEGYSQLSFPGKLAVDADYKGKQALVIADSGHDRILITALDGKVLEVIGSGNKGRADGSFEDVRFNTPQGLALKGDSLYIADTGNHELREANLKTRMVTTIAGDGAQGHVYEGRNMPALKVSIASPWDLTFYPDDRHLVVAMAGLHQLWSYDVVKKTLSVLAGTGDEGLEDGALLSAHLAQPSGVSAFDGKLYFVDAETSSLRVVEKGQVHTLIGSGLFDFGYKPGPRPVARMQHPLGLVATAKGVFVADAYNHSIRRYDTDKGVLEDYAGTGKRGVENGERAKAQFNEPSGLALGDKMLYVADANNRAIRAVDLMTQEVFTFKVQEETQKPVAAALADELPNTMSPSDPLVLASNTPIRLTLGLKAGWHINKDAPSYLAVFDLVQNNAAVVTFDRAHLQQNRMSIPARVGNKYQMQGTFYYCEDKVGAQCMVKSINVPLAFEKDAPQDYSIDLN